MRALVLSGGGSKGAYQVGVLRRLAELGRSYDILCGISVGALNTAFLAQYTDFGQGVTELERLWGQIDNDVVWKRWWPFGKLHGLWKPSFLNSAPLAAFVRDRLSAHVIRQTRKALCVGAVSLTSGRYAVWRENDDDIVDGVLASAAFPAFLSPQQIRSELWTDGGVREVTPLKNAIDLGATDIDVVITSPEGVSFGFEKPTAIKVAVRSLEIMFDEVVANDVSRAGLVNELVTAGAGRGKRYLALRTVRPKTGLTDDSLDFTPSSLKAMRMQGYADAKEVLDG